MVEAYPLSWPVGVPRSKDKKRARFRCNFSSAIKGIQDELRQMKAEKIVISSDVPLKKNGTPYLDSPRVKDVGVAVYFKREQREIVLACDRWDSIKDNAQGIALTLAAMRGMERWGASDLLDRVFQGFMALPAPSLWKPWHEVLGVHFSETLAGCEAAYRRLMKTAHPDQGGSELQAQELNRAIQEARKR